MSTSPNPRPEHEARLREGDPHRLNPFVAVAVAMKAGVRHVAVPQEFWKTVTDDDGFDAAEVRCPCGAVPTVELAAPASRCEGCERWFFYDGTDVLVLNTSTTTESTPA